MTLTSIGIGHPTSCLLKAATVRVFGDGAEFRCQKTICQIRLLYHFPVKPSEKFVSICTALHIQCLCRGPWQCFPSSHCEHPDLLKTSKSCRNFTGSPSFGEIMFVLSFISSFQMCNHGQGRSAGCGSGIDLHLGKETARTRPAVWLPRLRGCL